MSPRRELPTALDRLQMVFAGGSLQQARGQDVGGGNGVLDSPIYADTADRRHGVSRISIHNKPVGAKPEGVQQLQSAT